MKGVSGMNRIKFELSMPNVGSWNGKWTGEKNNYYRVYKMSKKSTKNLLGESDKKSWWYNFGDGWSASVVASIVPTGLRLPKSDGFCGYDWMIDSIRSYGEIKTK